MVFWSGKGFFSIMFLLLGIAVTQGCMEAFTGQKPAQQNHDLMWALSFTLAATANFFFVRYINKKPKQILIDKATGAEFELSGLGSPFFISTKWWTYIFAAVSAVFFIRLAWA